MRKTAVADKQGREMPSQRRISVCLPLFANRRELPYRGEICAAPNLFCSFPISGARYRLGAVPAPAACEWRFGAEATPIGNENNEGGKRGKSDS